MLAYISNNGKLVKSQVLGPILRISDSVGLE